MILFRRFVSVVSVVVALISAVPRLHAENSEASITNGLKGLRSLSSDKRPAAPLKLAQDIATLPAGLPKVKLAYNLASLSTEGDAGHDTLQAMTRCRPWPTLSARLWPKRLFLPMATAHRLHTTWN